ncbi:hypothetical protein ABZ214_40690 [Streptomyces iakyrus]|uniref:hypothetical protein n=1 Tax=Streptomyces iakyrus TaxID=68219 RepID=UPI0033A14BA2
MGSLLKGVSRIRWGELRDAAEAPAVGIPSLLSRIAHADEVTARLAIDELSDSVCALGCVVGEVTATTVPFLLELVGAPHVPCKAELMDLLASIYRTEQWHSAAAAARDQKNYTSYQEQPGWEEAARAAVYTGRPVLEELASSVRPEEAAPARNLLRVMDEAPPFPEL